jgi:16S rRNA (guanine527-N7)-methyltransferase
VAEFEALRDWLARLGETDVFGAPTTGAPATGTTLRARLEDERLAGQLQRYLREIELWNRKVGLVKASGTRLITHHLLDSLAAAPALCQELALSVAGESTEGESAPGSGAQQQARIADLGSGAGLPGIPLAIVLPELHVTLVERAERKAAFLRNVVAVLGLGNVEVEVSDYAKLGKRFDALVFRALLELDAEAAATLVQGLEPGGLLCAYKGSAERASAEAERIGGSFDGAKLVALTVPGVSEARHLVLARRPAEAPG